MKPNFSRPRRAGDNPHIEAFNSLVWRECLSQHWLIDFEHAQDELDRWRLDYNTVRQNGSLRRSVPAPVEEYMKEPCLIDPNEYPDDEVLERILGEVKPVWNSFLSFIKEAHPSFASEWRYYKDGKRWLFKITKKKKTICWVSVCEGMFSTTCYFTDKVEELLRNSDLKQEYLEQFANAKKYGKIRPLTVAILKPADLEMTRILIRIREKI